MADTGIVIILVIIVLAVFTWLIKLSFDLRKALDEGFHGVDEKISEVEHNAIDLKKQLNKMSRSLDEKIDRAVLEEKLDSLISLVKKKTRK